MTEITEQPTMNRADLIREWADKRRERGPQSEQTIDRYRKTGERLVARYGNLDRAIDALLRPDGPVMRKGTWLNIMAALRWHARQTGNTAMLRRLDGAALPPHRNRRASGLRFRRAKIVTPDDLKTIVGWLETAPGRSARILAANPDVDPAWATRASLYLLASSLTGLRPSEWSDARIVRLAAATPDEPDQFVLRARTGKAIHDEARYRDIPLEQEDDRQIVKSHLAEIAASPVPFETYLRRCQARLTAANKACFPGRRTRISLYSGRHTFHARLVSQKFPQTIIAYLMGHSPSSSEISGRSYGRGKSGSKIGPSYDPGTHHDQPAPKGTPATPRSPDTLP